MRCELLFLKLKCIIIEHKNVKTHLVNGHIDHHLAIIFITLENDLQLMRCLDKGETFKTNSAFNSNDTEGAYVRYWFSNCKIKRDWKKLTAILIV